MGALFSIIIFLVIAGVFAWNFVPSLRDKIRGWSTILEGLLGTAIYYFGQVSDGLKEAQAQGYIPDWAVRYVPLILLAWIILKRVQSKTPVGKKG